MADFNRGVFSMVLVVSWINCLSIRIRRLKVRRSLQFSKSRENDSQVNIQILKRPMRKPAKK